MSPGIILLFLASVAVLVAYFHFGGRLLGKYWGFLLIPVACVFLFGLYIFFSSSDLKYDASTQARPVESLGEVLFIITGEELFQFGGMLLMVGSTFTACVGSVIAYLSTKRKIKTHSQKNK